MRQLATPLDHCLGEWADIPLAPLARVIVIYRLFDAEDRCLYVGQTAQRPPGLRVEQHRRGQPWGSEIARAEYAVIQTARYTPEQVELAEIARSNPIYNKVR